MFRRLAVTALLICFLAASGSAASPSGFWRGSWTSQTTGHRGPLKAHIRQTAPDTYRAVFVGRFAGVVPFVYPAKLERAAGSCDCYTSSQRLPLLGTYKMSAHIDANQFNATFRGRKDRGTFRMSR